MISYINNSGDWDCDEIFRLNFDNSERSQSQAFIDSIVSIPAGKSSYKLADQFRKSVDSGDTKKIDDLLDSVSRVVSLDKKGVAIDFISETFAYLNSKATDSYLNKNEYSNIVMKFWEIIKNPIINRFESDFYNNNLKDKNTALRTYAISINKDVLYDLQKHFRLNFLDNVGRSPLLHQDETWLSFSTKYMFYENDDKLPRAQMSQLVSFMDFVKDTVSIDDVTRSDCNSVLFEISKKARECDLPGLLYISEQGVFPTKIERPPTFKKRMLFTTNLDSDLKEKFSSMKRSLQAAKNADMILEELIGDVATSTPKNSKG